MGSLRTTHPRGKPAINEGMCLEAGPCGPSSNRIRTTTTGTPAAATNSPSLQRHAHRIRERSTTKSNGVKNALASLTPSSAKARAI